MEENNTHLEEQVNGQDLAKSTHEDAVEAFRTAKEPIVVEVLRRVSKNNSRAEIMKTRSSSSSTMVSVATQTDDYIDDQGLYGSYRPPTPPPALFALNGNGLYQPSSRAPLVFSPSQDMGLTDIELANGLDFDDTYDDDRTYEMEYEEVTLHRQSIEEKVGLTLCYGAADDEVTDIFIGEIEPYSIAAQDGRIREGDHILQINGVDVHSRDQAIKLFAASLSDISLLLARPQLQMDDGFMEERNVTLDDLHMEMLEQGRHQLQGDEEGGTTDTATTENSNKHEKDSGVGRTDESCRNDESSEQEIMENDCASPASNPKFRPGCNLGSGDLHFSNDSFTSNEAHEHDFHANEIAAEECAKFREVLENRCSAENSPCRNIPRKDSQSSIEREIAQLNKEMEDIQLECQEIVESHVREQQKLRSEPIRDPYRSPRLVPRMGTRLEYVAKQAQQAFNEPVWIPHMNGEGKTDTKDTRRSNIVTSVTASSSSTSTEAKDKNHKDSSSASTSAYNTGDSCRSTPLTLELTPNDDPKNGGKGSSLHLAPSLPCLSDSEKTTQTPPIANDFPHESNSSDGGKRKSKNSMRGSSSSGSVKDKNTISSGMQSEVETRADSLAELCAKYSDVMYTNQANLEHTMQIQQQIFQQQILQQQQKTRGGGRRSHRSGSQSQDNGMSQLSGSENQPMEWVVKRRADGSRYVTRRPMRNRLLKERAKKITEERCGLTTDDDAMSEMKVGRYWSKEDRKKHLERARDHRRRRECIMRQKMETLKEQNECEKKEVNIVELSHKKMMRHKGKKVFDDFTTVQEMLAHGNKHTDGKTYNPLLSVTTV